MYWLSIRVMAGQRGDAGPLNRCTQGEWADRDEERGEKEYGEGRMDEKRGNEMKGVGSYGERRGG